MWNFLVEVKREIESGFLLCAVKKFALYLKMEKNEEWRNV
jgi:hypothetical protein